MLCAVVSSNAWVPSQTGLFEVKSFEAWSFGQIALYDEVKPSKACSLGRTKLYTVRSSEA